MKDGEWKRLWHDFVGTTDGAGLRAKSQDYAELLSEPMRVPEAQTQGLSAEASFDLSTGWDCRKMSHRKQAWAYLKKQPKRQPGPPHPKEAKVMAEAVTRT